MELTEEKIQSLIKEVNSFYDKAYVPYSNFPVAAIVIDDKGNKTYGTNVENASYGLSLCAERNAITSAITKGMKKISILVVSGYKLDSPISPCGACRQVIAEFSTDDTIIILANAKNNKYLKFRKKDLLPYAFEGKIVTK